MGFQEFPYGQWLPSQSFAGQNQSFAEQKLSRMYIKYFA
jgi:hypothetical protein